MAIPLSAPFDPAVVSWRVGPTNREKTKGMALAYIDARDVMNRLDEAVGPANWQADYPWSDGKRIVCRIGIRMGDEWVWKADGAGETDMEGEKGAFSDAFKRAAVKWGVGRYLYDLDSPWVEIEARGNSYFIPDRELSRLAGRLKSPAQSRVSSPPADGAAARVVPDGGENRDNPSESNRAISVAAFKRIKAGILAQKLPAGIDQFLALNDGDMQHLLKYAKPGHEDLMALAAARKTEMLASA